jgi:putative nucleotidyltransferase with HDIG domain
MVRKMFVPERGRLYVGIVTLAGSAIIAHSIIQVFQENLGPQWIILAALTLLSGSATVKLPSVPATISISETFVFTSVLLFGPSAGATIVALDGLIISSWFARRRKEFYRIAFNMAAPAMSIWLAAQLYFSFPGVKPLVSSTITIDRLLFPLLVFTLCHFLVNSWLIALAVRFETGRTTLDIWRRDFLWLSLNYFGGASVSALLVVYTRDINISYLGIIVPLLLILYFTFKIPMARVEDTNKHLTKVNSLYLSTIETLALAIDAKDQVTHGHIRRVQTFAIELAKAIGITDAIQLKAIEASALLHDMGKLAIPEHILNKPGKLTSAEFEKMKLHASIGADILSSIEFPYPVVPIVRHHHENWDGSGYPDGLFGVDIPMGARILSVVDCYDALTSDRPYRPRMTTDEALAILRERRGNMYDPLVVDTFVRLQPMLYQFNYEPSDLHAALSTETVSTGDILEAKRSREARPDSLSIFLLHQLLSEAQDRSWEDTADLILHRLSQVLPADDLAVFIYDPIADELVCDRALGANESGLKSKRMKLGEGISGWVGAHKRTMVNSHAAVEFQALKGSLGRLKSALSVPLILNSELVGVITVYSRVLQPFSERNRELLERIARQLATLVARARIFAKTSKTSAGFPSARHLDEYIRRHVTSKPGAPLCLVALRVFAPDRFGHQLSVLLGRLTSSIRGGDLIFVCDDSTVVCLLEDTTDCDSDTVAVRLLGSIDGELDEQFTTTVVVAPRDGCTLATLLDCAEARMNAIAVDNAFRVRTHHN